jgi:hypothetical protein
MTERRFPPPWTVEKIPGGLKVCDANGQSLAYVYSRENAELSAEGITDPEAWPLWQGPTIWWLGCSR